MRYKAGNDVGEQSNQPAARHAGKKMNRGSGGKIVLTALFSAAYTVLWIYCLFAGNLFWNVLLLFLTFLMVWCGVKFFVARFAVRGRLESDPVIRAYKKKDAPVCFELQNKSIFSYPVCVVSYVKKEGTFWRGEEGVTVCNLLPRRSHRLVFQLHYDYRGTCLLELNELEIRGDLAFFSRKKPLSLQARILVYPDIVPLSRFDSCLQTNDEAFYDTKAMTDEITDFMDIREYQEQDSIRRVHWKLSSRMDHLMTKQFHESSEERACVYFDLALEQGCSRHQQLVREDKIAELCASVCYFLLENQIPFRFFYPAADRIEDVECLEEGTFQYIYDLLATLPFAEAGKTLQTEVQNVICGPESARISVYLFTLCLSEELLSSVKALQLLGYRLIVFFLDSGLPGNVLQEKQLQDLFETAGARVIRCNSQEETRKILEGV